MEKINRGLSQRVNMAGVRFALQLFTTKRRHAIPHIAVKNISSIDWDRIKAAGFKGCVFDKDNTLTHPYALCFCPDVKESVRDCVRAFGESGVALLSNSAGLLQYDPSGAEADAIEKKLGLSVLRHRRKKPAKEPGLLEAHFGAEAHELVMVGDRTFTDVAFGNAMGMLTIKCAPFTSKGENFLVKMARGMERFFVRLLLAAGCAPPLQKLAQSAKLDLTMVAKRDRA